MKFRRSYSFFILVLAGTWVSFPTVGIPQTQTPPDCLAAKAFFDKKLYEDAERIYNNLLKNNYKPDCAKEGLKEVYEQAITLYEEGKKFQTAGQPKLEKAQQKYSEAISIYPKFEKAKQALKEVEALLNKQKEEKFNAAHQLAKIGLYAEARDKIKKIIEEDPNAEVTDKEKNIFGGQSILDWQSILNWLGLWIPIVVSIYLLFIIINYLWEVRSHSSLYIEDFDKGGTELDIGQTLAAMVEEECQNVHSKEDVQSVARKMTIVTAPTGKLELPDVKSLVPQLGIFSQLANILPSLLSLLGRKFFTLSGYLHPASDRGVGLTLTLKNEQGNIIYNCTIWQKDYDPELSSKSDNSKNPTPYYFLVEPAAIWTLFQLDDQITKLEIKKWSGVKNWKSYAYFRAGVYWRLQDKNIEIQNNLANLMFSNALNEDLNNRFAILNLGILDTLNNEYNRARERLILAKKMSDESQTISIYQCQIFKDVVWYKSSYQLAANYLYVNDFPKAEQEASILCSYIENDIECNKYLRSFYTREEAKYIHETLYSIVPSISTESSHKDFITKLADKLNKGLLNEKDCNLYINNFKQQLVCEKSKEWLHNIDKNISFLEAMQQIAFSVYAVVLVMNKKIAEAEDNISKLSAPHSYRTYYNLACYHSCLVAYHSRDCLNIYEFIFKYNQNHHYAEGLRFLKNALDLKPSLAKWAQKDPSLKALREHQETQSDFNKLIVRYNPP